MSALTPIMLPDVTGSPDFRQMVICRRYIPYGIDHVPPLSTSSCPAHTGGREAITDSSPIVKRFQATDRLRERSEPESIL